MLKYEAVLYNMIIIYFYRDVDQTPSDSLSYHFDMSALCGHLKTQGEENKTASYFRTDDGRQVIAIPHMTLWVR
jgi:hypothetical protein